MVYPLTGIDSCLHDLNILHTRCEAYLTKDSKQILLRRTGVRNKSGTEGFFCAASSSSCMTALKTFNNNHHKKLLSCHAMCALGGPHGGCSRPLAVIVSSKSRQQKCTDM